VTDQPQRLYEQIAQVAHEAVRVWRTLRGESHVVWEHADPDHRQAYVEQIRRVVAEGATTRQLHQARTEAGLVDAGQSTTAQLKETALVHATATALGCGQERWDVKTGTDALAGTVVMTAKQTTVAELIAFAAPPPDPPTRVAGEPECQLYTIDVTITQAKMETDSDYHLALDDGQGNTMIAEAVSPGCASRSPWLGQIQTARAAVDAAIPGLTDQYQDVGRAATITGVGFFDRLHGQLGVAKNGIELHPVLDIVFH